MNVVFQIFIFITPEILLSDTECMRYHANQIIFHSICPNWSHVFVVMASILNYFNDYDDCTICHQLQENSLSHLNCEEVGSVVQIIRRDVQIDLHSLNTN